MWLLTTEPRVRSPQAVLFLRRVQDVIGLCTKKIERPFAPVVQYPFQMLSLPVPQLLIACGLPQFPKSGLPKNIRKQRNRKVQHAFKSRGAIGISELLLDSDFQKFTEPKRFGIKARQGPSSTRLSCSPGLDTSGYDGTPWPGSWTSSKRYDEDSPRGWTHVGHGKRRRARPCMIQEDPEEEFEYEEEY